MLEGAKSLTDLIHQFFNSRQPSNKQESISAMPTIFPNEANIDNKTILLTGGTGSFGKMFIHYVLNKHNPKKVIIYSRDEDKQYHVNNHIRENYKASIHSKVRFFLGDVRDVKRLTMASQNVDILIHAAAVKHVSAAEYNPMECVKTNIHGAENVVEAALANNIPDIIALSTDKAVNPINLYGATKLAADKIFVAANHLTGGSNIRFANVRYGNVLGSRGSVVPYFNSLIGDGSDTLPITNTEMTRFWITIDQGISFVLSCLSIMRGGETFVPKIPSMKITDVARVMAPKLKQKIIGIRPGEKLHEVMISSDDAGNTFDLGDRFVIRPSIKFYDDRYDYLKDSQPVAENFSYSSDNNTEWLSDGALKAMLSEQLPK